MHIIFSCDPWEDETNELNWYSFFDKGFSTKEQANFELDCLISKRRMSEELNELNGGSLEEPKSNLYFKIVEVKIND